MELVHRWRGQFWEVRVTLENLQIISWGGGGGGAPSSPRPGPSGPSGSGCWLGAAVICCGLAALASLLLGLNALDYK